jgi:hypothetical protein
MLFDYSSDCGHTLLRRYRDRVDRLPRSFIGRFAGPAAN